MISSPGTGRSERWQQHRLKDHRLIRACFQQPHDTTPVWFMRQAGSYIPEHKKLMDEHGLLTLTSTPELCAEVTTLPVQVLGVDAAVMFADIIIPLGGMGIDFHYEAGLGPVIENPLRCPQDVEALRVLDPQESVGFILQAIELVQQRLDGHTPLIGFSGGPFTLAGYMIEGRPSRTFPLTKKFMYDHPGAWQELMDVLSESIIRYLQAQARAGIDVIQLFDSWIGVLTPLDFGQYVLPYTRRIYEELQPLGLPRIHFGTATASLLPQLASLPVEVVSVDWRVDLGWAWQQLDGQGIQGNLEPALLLSEDSQLVAKRAAQVLDQAAERPGHIFNLGHRVDLRTPVENLQRLVDVVHEYQA